MNGDTLYSIGDLARRTGLTVKTIRFYSDREIVPPVGRSPAGHRLYDIGAVARLELVRTLRELGLDLPTIGKIVQREITLAEVATAQAEALAVQIRTLRLRHAVMTAVARRGSTPEEMEFMHKLAKLSADERERLIGDFLDAVFGGMDTDVDFTGIRCSLTPELPDDPEVEQVEAWVELAELSQDPDFRFAVRCLAEQYVADLASGGAGATAGPRRDAVAIVAERVGLALEAGIEPTSPQAVPIVEAVTAHYARALGRPDEATDTVRRRLWTVLDNANDLRRERYLRLLSVINGWETPESLTPRLDWFIQALHARMPVRPLS